MSNRFKTALDIQDASNAVAVAGVVHQMLKETLDPQDAAVKLAIHQLCALTIGEHFQWDYSTAYQECERLSMQPTNFSEVPNVH